MNHAVHADSYAQCLTNGFQNAYYLIDINQIVPVSNFYRGMSENSLKDLQDYSADTGQPFIAVKGNRTRISRYFDFDSGSLLQQNRELVLHLDKNLPAYRLEREFINYIDLVNPLNSRQFESRNYNRKTSAYDKHPLFSKVKRRERSILINLLAESSQEKAATISEKLTVISDDLVYLITHFGVEQGTVTLSSFNISDYGLSNTSSLLKLELNYKNFSKLNSDEQVYLNRMFCDTALDLESKVAGLEKINHFGYAQYNYLAERALPSRQLLQQQPVLFSFGQIFILSLLGFLILTLMLGRYKNPKVYRHIKISREQK